MKKQSYPVSTLLEESHLADHFYALVKGLTGKDAIYKNPGASLRSLVITACRDRIVELNAEDQATYDECVSFNLDASVRQQIGEAMRSKPYELLDRIAQAIGPCLTTNVALRHVNALVQTLDSSEPAPQDVLPSAWVQALIELKRATEELAQVLESLPIKA